MMSSRYWQLLGIISIALFLRLATINNHGVWIDETWVVTTPTFHYGTDNIYPKFFEYPQVKSLPHNYQSIIKRIYNLGPITQICFMVASDMHPPFFYMVSYYWTRIFGESLYAIRSLSIIFNLISIVMLYMLVQPKLGNGTALISSGVLACSPMFVHYSQMARNYSLMVLLVIVSFYLLDRLLRRFTWPLIFSYSLTIYLAILTHYYSIFFVLAQIFLVLNHELKNNKLLWRWVFVYLIVATCYIPWLPALYIQFVMRNPTEQSMLAPFSFKTVLDQFYALGFWPSLTELYIPKVTTMFLKICNVIILLYLITYGLVKSRIKGSEDLTMFIIWGVVPILLGSIVALAKPLYSVKSLLPVLPAFSVLVTSGIMHISNSYHLRSLIISFLGTIMIVSQFIWPTYPGIESTEDTRGAVEQLSSHIRELDTIVVQPSFYRDGVWYYMKKDMIPINEDSEIDNIPIIDNKIWFFRYWDKSEQTPLFHGKMPDNTYRYFGVSVYEWGEL